MARAEAVLAALLGTQSGEQVGVPGVLEAIAALLDAAPSTAVGREHFSASEAQVLAGRIATTIVGFIEERRQVRALVAAASAEACAPSNAVTAH